MVLSQRQMINLLAASSVSVLALVLSAHSVEAASVSASATVTIENAGGVGGTPTDPVPETPVTDATTEVPVSIAEAFSTTSPGFTIRSAPTLSATSSVGFGPVASAGQAAGVTSETGGGSSSSSATSGTSSAPRFSNPNVSTAGLKGASSVVVAGSPNQAYSVILPELTAYTSSGQLVTLSNFQHNAGSTPFLGNDGSAQFNVGAQVNQSPLAATSPDGSDNDDLNALRQLSPSIQTITSSLSDATLIGGDRATVLASAFTNRSPFVNIVVSYN